SRSNTSCDFVQRTISSSVDLVVRREAFRFAFLISDTSDNAAFELQSCYLCEKLLPDGPVRRDRQHGGRLRLDFCRVIRVIAGDVVDYLDKLAEHPFIRLAPLGFSVVGFACHASTLRLSSMLFLTLAGSAFSALRRS